MAWARLFLRGLASSGVERVVVSPGSRSTPLVLAAAGEAALTCDVVVDERAAAFFALGQVRATGKPSVLLCTSGTAAAHYFPAVIEASQSFLPLVVVTADRPWEAYDAATSQTVDQVKLFGSQVRHYAELGLPDVEALPSVLRIASQAVKVAMGPLPGPVHVNARFRKPLEPVEGVAREPWESTFDALMERGAPRVFPSCPVVDERGLETLVSACRSARRGLLVCGPSLGAGSAAKLRAAVAAVQKATGFPVLAEATSQVRFGPVRGCGSFDALLRARACRQAPDLILEVGAPAISPGLAALVAEYGTAARFVVAPYGWNDPEGTAQTLLWGDPAEVLAQLAERVDGTPDPTWRDWFDEADARAKRCVQRELDDPVLHEGQVASGLVDALRQDATLFVGNSLPVRDLDTFARSSYPFAVLHQRGASGIDGLVAGAAGIRSVVTGPVVLYLGDVSLVHDLGSLVLARRATAPLVVVVVQNGGGRIFEQLPIGQRSELAVSFERFFATPEPLDLSHAAGLFGIAFVRVTTPGGFTEALGKALVHNGCTLLEAVVPPHDGALRRRRLWKAIESAVTDV